MVLLEDGGVGVCPATMDRKAYITGVKTHTANILGSVTINATNERALGDVDDEWTCDVIKEAETAMTELKEYRRRYEYETSELKRVEAEATERAICNKPTGS